jgi:hypothetical protein
MLKPFILSRHGDLGSCSALGFSLTWVPTMAAGVRVMMKFIAGRCWRRALRLSM